jgi:hypothetical protein
VSARTRLPICRDTTSVYADESRVHVDATSVHTEANFVCVDATSVQQTDVHVRADGGVRTCRKFTLWLIYLFIFYTRTLQCLEVTDTRGATVLILVLVRLHDNFD